MQKKKKKGNGGIGNSQVVTVNATDYTYLLSPAVWDSASRATHPNPRQKLGYAHGHTLLILAETPMPWELRDLPYSFASQANSCSHFLWHRRACTILPGDLHMFPWLVLS